MNDNRTAEQQAMEDALLSSDAARAMEILRRTLAHGTKVPDPDLAEAMATEPTEPPCPTAPRRGWVRAATPWSFAALGIVAIASSLGWSYSDYENRQEEWRRIADEQTTLAKQQEQLATERAVLLRQSEEARAEMIAREERSQEIRRRQIDRVERAKASGDLCGAVIVWTNLADDILAQNVDDKATLQELLQSIDHVIHDDKATTHVSP